MLYMLNKKIKIGKKQKIDEIGNERERKDKTETIQKFKIMSNEQFGVWLLNECKWKHKITKDDIASIRFSIDTYIEFIKTNQSSSLS
ncbi:hypothetical protein RFI_22156 [Reticulomyxa filosa]|uniref:Uncharacterized protein n=1 Tax=Reticulomyxa filosa TaxID=46433 RepID=X6MP36_RETFI|nr:hypothetical protein RFI_22156 [Reticulomyxa filosa]|eukprot:ETO15207.1 hypothetical protein RFI_22156 [Reticulomyxa filosa]